MPKTKPAPLTETQHIARRIVDDVLTIQSSSHWHDIQERLISIQRSARALLSDTTMDEITPTTIEEEIAAGYRKAVERHLEEARLMILLIDDQNTLNAQTIGLCLTMMNMTMGLMEKYLRATTTAQSTWEHLVKKAEAEMGLHAHRPLDIDGQPQGDDQDDDHQPELQEAAA